MEFTYVAQKLNGAIYGSAALLSSVRDVLNQIWTYRYYGQVVGETVTALVSNLLERTSPSVDLTGDGVTDNTITLEKVGYAASSPTQVTSQKRGQVGSGTFLEETAFTFQANGGSDTLASLSQSDNPSSNDLPF